MRGGKQRSSARRCAICNKVGHNKSTCPSAHFVPSQKTHSVPNPLKFFVHHVTTKPSESPHVIDLKTETPNVWDTVATVAPEKSKSPRFHFYHNSPTSVSTPPLSTAQPDFATAAQTSWRDRLHDAKDFVWSRLKKFKPQKSAPLLPTPRQVTPTPALSAPHEPVLERWHKKITSAFSSWATPKLALTMAVVASVIFIAPFPAKSYISDLTSTAQAIATNGTAGFLALHESTTALFHADFTAANNATDNALERFSTASELLATKHQLLQTIAGAVPGVSGQLDSRKDLLLAGQEIALGNSYLVKTLAELKNATTTPLLTRINVVVAAAEHALPSYQLALNHIQTVDPKVLPVEYQAPFNDFKKIFSAGVNDLTHTVALGKSLNEIFGGTGFRRYLIVFQNPAELRATGGFMGSFAVVEVKNGAITKLDVPAGGSYDLQGQLDTYLEPPTPLLLSNKRWEFQDANWFPDFPTTAEKILWFYRHSRGVTADGVIAVNATVLERLLTLVGPITDETRGVTLTSESALPTLQNIVENGPEKQLNKPKQILTDLAPRLFDSLKNINPSATLPLLTNAEEALRQKEIQAYFADPETEKVFRSFNWDGAIAPTNPNQDYLLLVNTNIQGAKSDAKMLQSISHQALVQPDGSIIDTVEITREHTGSPNDGLYGQTNIDYIRLYVPEGSQLISASGFSWPDEKIFRVPETWYKKDQTLETVEKFVGVDNRSGTRITKEFNKFAFSNWVITEPGAISKIQFVYRLPNKIFDTSAKNTSWLSLPFLKKPTSQYQLVVQRQSGANSTFEHQVIFPDTWRPHWFNGIRTTAAENGLRVAPGPLDEDTVWSVLMEQK